MDLCRGVANMARLAMFSSTEDTLIYELSKMCYVLENRRWKRREVYYEKMKQINQFFQK